MRSATGYLFGSLQPDPGSASTLDHHQRAPELGTQIENIAKSLKGCGSL